VKWREIREVDLICQFHHEINATDTNKLTPNLGKYASKRRLIGVMALKGGTVSTGIPSLRAHPQVVFYAAFARKADCPEKRSRREKMASF
jgi:hypothetical protein